MISEYFFPTRFLNGMERFDVQPNKWMWRQIYVYVVVSEEKHSHK